MFRCAVVDSVGEFVLLKVLPFVAKRLLIGGSGGCCWCSTTVVTHATTAWWVHRPPLSMTCGGPISAGIVRSCFWNVKGSILFLDPNQHPWQC